MTNIWEKEISILVGNLIFGWIYSQLTFRKMLHYVSFSGIVEWLIYHMSVYSCVYCWHDLTVLKWKKNLFGFQTYSCVKHVLFSLVHQSLFEVTFAFSYFIFRLVFRNYFVKGYLKGNVSSVSDSFPNLIHHFFYNFFLVWAFDEFVNEL